MSLFARLLSPCWFSHQSDPLIVMHGKTMRYECSRCMADLGTVLPGQMYPVRPTRPLKAVVGTVKDRDLADVVTLAKWSKR